MNPGEGKDTTMKRQKRETETQGFSLIETLVGVALVAIAMLGLMMVGDWFAQRRGRRREIPPPEDEF